jgi:hypothetical protein
MFCGLHNIQFEGIKHSFRICSRELVSRVTWLLVRRPGLTFWQRQEVLLINYSIQTRSEAQTVSYLLELGTLSPGLKRKSCEADHLLQSSSEEVDL